MKHAASTSLRCNDEANEANLRFDNQNKSVIFLQCFPTEYKVFSFVFLSSQTNTHKRLEELKIVVQTLNNSLCSYGSTYSLNVSCFLNKA